MKTEDYAKLLGDDPKGRLKELLTQREKALSAIDKATDALNEALKAEDSVRGQIIAVLDEAGGEGVRDAKREILHGRDVLGAVQLLLRDGRHDMGLGRDNFRPAPPCAALAAWHPQIQKLI